VGSPFLRIEVLATSLKEWNFP